MPGYKSNAKSVLGDCIKRLQGIQTGAVDKIVREIAIDLASSNLNRIHNEGRAVDGDLIGEYPPSRYRNKRLDTGKEVDYVNLTFTGKLSKEFTIEAVSDSEIGVGFLTEYGANLQELLEGKYGKTIWGVTEEDERVAREIEKNRMKKYLKEAGLI